MSEFSDDPSEPVDAPVIRLNGGLSPLEELPRLRPLQEGGRGATAVGVGAAALVPPDVWSAIQFATFGTAFAPISPVAGDAVARAATLGAAVTVDAAALGATRPVVADVAANRGGVSAL